MGFEVTRISKRWDWSEGLCTLTLDLTADFRAGQFFNLALDLAGERVRRSYSVASAPGAPLEFYLTRVAEGALTPALFELPVGGELLIDPQPQGFFTFDYLPPAADLWLVSTGTGLGPFISMLRTDEPWQRSEHIVIVNGVRERCQLAYLDELRELAQTRHADAELRVVSCVSREEPPAGGVVGRIPAAIEDGRLEHAAGMKLSPNRSHVLLCGNPDMIRDTQVVLERRGLRKHRQRKPGHFSFEKYW